MALNINGRMKVKTLRADFKKEFGLTLRVYDGRSFANDDSTLAAIRKGDSKGGEFGPRKNTKVGNLEDKIMDMFGIKTQVAGSDDSYLCDNDLTLSGALEADQKKMEKKSKKSAKTVTVEFKFKAKGVQISSYEINEETQRLLEQNADDGFPRSPVEIFEENCHQYTLLTYGISASNDNLEKTVSIDGKEQPFAIADSELADFSVPGEPVVIDGEGGTIFYEQDALITERLMADSVLSAQLKGCILDVDGANEAFYNYIPGKSGPIAEGNAVIYEIIPYSTGTLRISFEADKDFKLQDVRLLKDDPDQPGVYESDWIQGATKYELSNHYYTEVLWEVMDSHPDSALDEDTIRGIIYKGERHDGELDFMGGNGWYQSFTRSDDGSKLIVSYVINGWLNDASEESSEESWDIDDLLLMDEDEEDLAQNPDTPASVLEKLADNEDEHVRNRVAGNPNTPASVLEKLAGDETVRWIVAENSSTPASVLEKLSEDEDEDVRREIAGNSSTPASVLEKLSEDEEDSVRCQIAGNSSTPVSLLEKLSEDEDEDVRRRVAENSSTPATVLEKLAADEDKYVRGEVAENSNTSVSVLEKLAKDEDEDVRDVVTDNPNYLK